MVFPEQYESDAAFFFERRPAERALYEELLERMERAVPEALVRVQKSQISFYGRHLFAAVSLRRRREWPKPCIVLTLGLPERPLSPRVAEAVEPYPGRWTCHVPLWEPAQLDPELLDWVRQAWNVSENK